MKKAKQLNPNITPRLQHQKNAIRSAHNKVRAFTHARQTLDPYTLEQIAAWGAPWLSQLGLMFIPKPRRFSELKGDRLLSPVAHPQEVAWALGFLSAHIRDLKAYIAWSESFDACLIGGSADDLVKSVSEMEAGFGYSFRGISLKFAVLQLCKGVEYQKTYLTEVLGSQAGQMLKYVAYWMSVRSEEFVPSAYYIEDITKRIGQFDLSVSTKSILTYQLLHTVPSAEGEVFLLCSHYSTSIIDLYEVFVALATEAICENRPTSEVWLKAIRSLSSEVRDRRLNNLLAISGDIRSLGWLPVGNARFRSNEMGNSRLKMSYGSADTFEEFLSLVRSNASGEPGNPIAQKIAQAINDAQRPGENSSRASAVFLKMGMMIGRHPMGRRLAYFSVNTRSFEPPFTDHIQRLLFAQSQALEPEGVLIVPSAMQELYIAKLQKASTELGDAGHVIAGNAPRTGIASLSQKIFDHCRLYHAATAAPSLLLAVSTECIEAYRDRESIYLVLSALLSADRHKDALELSVSLMQENNEYSVWMPLKEIASKIYLGDTNQFPSSIEASIFFYHYAQDFDADASSYRSYTAEDFLLTLGVDRPSRLDGTAFRLPYIVPFLADVCNLATLKLFSAFETERELEDERITVCRILSNLDPERREHYEDEALSLVRSRIVKEAIRHLQASKISIDEAALLIWAQKNVAQEFSRYQALLKGGLVVIDEQYKQALKVAIETGVYPKSLYDVPDNEATVLFLEVVRKISQQCSFDPEHGLDCYLSLRIRHGTLSGMLRSGAERERVVTRLASETGAYRQNEFWENKIYRAHSGTEWEQIDDRMATFSRALDHVINETTQDFVQIARPEKPRGLFELEPPLLSIFGLASDVTTETTFAEFWQRNLDIYWIRVDQSLKAVRLHLATKTRKRIRELFDALEADLRSNPDCIPIADATLRARSETELALESTIQWFELPTPTAAVEFSIDEMISVALESVKNFHRDFSPSISTVRTDLKVRGALRLFSDIFFVVFENVYKHSGTLEPEIQILAELQDEKLVTIVENSMSRERLTVDFSRRVDTARERIRSGAYLRDLSKEGGTGFPKLAKLINFKSGKSTLEFGLNVKRGFFWLEFSLPVQLFSEEVVV